jgi:5'-methylthioadenosine phosphorylase
MSRVGLIGGTSADFSFELREELQVATEWGDVPLAVMSAGSTEVLFVRRHGLRHETLSSMVSHRANIRALKEAGAEAILATTVCGVVDPDVPLARAIVFDDLFFPGNRLPDGAPCTFFDKPAEQGRGHYIFGSPFSPLLRQALLAAADEIGMAVQSTGTYAHMLGPRFNTRAEIAWLRSLGVTAISQTAGPEAVLAGELELPYALLGFGVDYANGVGAEPTPVDELNANIVASKRAFDSILARALETLEPPTFDTGFVYRFE